ncbi:RNase P/RNase MRP subunit POP5 [Metallosphaera yellowstonensis MK1]|jgi:ribonuclease P/MRP protein subunit POP5|uniref:Ribonuclease P protein component 2 n=2 Tax=Metallosphaera TaxID=41980 RepID=H2C6M0_9CREN|nr:RNase P/RNase MRP subunit POP5 [Metallosphaera yellowstonensis MK1]
MLQLIIDILLIVWLVTLTYLSFRRKSEELKPKVPRLTLRKNKKRYIVFKVLSDHDDINVQDMEKQIRMALQELLGKVWLDISNPRVVIYDPGRMSGIISTNRLGYKAVLAALPFVKSVEDKEILLVPVRTTGSLKKAKHLMRQ